MLWRIRLLFSVLVVLLLFGNAPKAESIGLPSEMMYFKVHLIQPQVPAGAYGAEPREIWRAGSKYFRLEEGVDFDMHLQQLLVGNQSDMWAINLLTNRAVHASEPGAPAALLPIFPTEERDFLSSLEFGQEKKFFSDPRTIVSKGPALNGSATTKYELAFNGKRVVLITDNKSNKPLRLALMDPSSPYTHEYEYLRYESMPFDAKKFAIPPGLKIVERKELQDNEMGNTIENQTISKEMMSFYKSGKRNELPLLFKRMETVGWFDESETSQNSCAFITAAIAANPGLVSQWCQSVCRFNLAQRLWFWDLVSRSGTNTSSNCLKQIAAQMGGKDKQFIDSMSKRRQSDLMQTALSAPVLDQLWFSYFASGDSKYVKRIMEALPWINQTSQSSIAATLTGQAARWSLSANCQQDQNVLNICQKERATNPKLAKYLIEVLPKGKQIKGK